MAAVAKAEAELRAAVAKDPALQAEVGGSWDKVAQAMAQRCRTAKEDALIGSRGSERLEFALGLARLAEESAKPAAQRSAGYRTEQDLEKRRTRLRTVEFESQELETAAFTAGLTEAFEELGAAHPFVAAALEGRTPEAAAKALLAGTKLGAADARKALLDGGAKALKESTDPLVVLALKVEALAQPLRRQREETQAVIAEHGARIAKARFKVRGRSVYPDATFTLRLSYGSVETYPANGTLAQPFTTFGGLYDRADGWGPEAEDHSWQLPQRWVDARGKLNLRTHYDFISSNDIIGGNSGSPVVDRAGKVIGLAFDGNIESNAGRFFFDPKVNRTVSVDGAAILEALDKVYGASALVREIASK
jgi:hypothetical protein